MQSSAFAKLFKIDSEWDSIHKLKNLFRDAKNNEHVIDEVIALKCLKNYENLYQQYRRLTLDARHHIDSAWQLLILSGENEAAMTAINTLHITKDTKNKLGENALHIAALSGNMAQVKLMQEQLPIPWDTKSAIDANVLHYAIMSGENSLVNEILKQENAKQFITCSLQKRNVLHLAAATKNVELVKNIFGFLDEKTIFAQDENGYTAVNYAIKHYNASVVNFLTHQGLQPLGNQDDCHYGEIDKTWKIESEARHVPKMS